MVYVWIGGAFVAVAVGIMVAPHAKRVWKESVVPRTRRLWAKVTNRAQEDRGTEDVDLRAEAVEPEVTPPAVEASDSES